MSSQPEFSATVPSKSAVSMPLHRPLSARDREAADGLATSLHAVYGILGDPVLTCGLRERGFDVDEFQTGLTLQTAAEDVFVECQAALGALDRAASALTAGWENAREEYLEFRGMARSWPDEVSASELGVSGTVMPGFVAFVAQANGSYVAAKAPAYREALARRGYDAERLRRLAQELVSLTELREALDRLRANVERQLDERDLALAMFNLWVRELLQQARMVAGATFRPPDFAAMRQRIDALRSAAPSPLVRATSGRPVPRKSQWRGNERHDDC